jgi:hypothetical protein
MRPFEIGLVLPTMQFGPTRETARWPQIREIAMTAESMGAQVDLMVSPGTLPAFEALAPVVEQLRAERP